MTETIKRPMLKEMAREMARVDGYGLAELDKMEGDPRLDPVPEYTRNAKAALYAIMEPSEEVLVASGMLDADGRELARSIWKDMISAILTGEA